MTDRTAGPDLQDQGPATALFQRRGNFVSLRLKLLLPLFVPLLVAAMTGTYVVSATLMAHGDAAQASQIQMAAFSAQQGMQRVYEAQVNEATRIAFLNGLAAAVEAGDVDTLHRLLEPEAVAAGLDSIIVTDASGQELLGLQRSSLDSRADYAVSTGASLAGQPLLQRAIVGAESGVNGLMASPTGLTLYTTWPLRPGDATLGQLLVGQGLDRVMGSLRGSSLAQVGLFAPSSGKLLHSTFQASSSGYETLPLTPQQVLADTSVLPIVDLSISGYPFQGAYLPLTLGTDTLGVLAVFLPSSLPYATELGVHLVSLLLSVVAALVVMAAFVGLTVVLSGVENITGVVRSLADGRSDARTGLAPLDELGELGHALDVYADRVQMRQGSLQKMLRRQRRESARLTAVLESMPDGVIVQDLDGRVLMMNEQARLYLGSKEALYSNAMASFTAAVTDVLGPSLAPGIYRLGSPQHVRVRGAVLSAQAAAILTMTGKRVGTVIGLRDVTESVQREQAQAALLQELARDVQEPLMDLVGRQSLTSMDPSLQRFADEVMINALRLQRLVLQLHDLSELAPERLTAGQRPLLVQDLLDDLVAEWGSTAQASELLLQATVLKTDMYILGDERRLRWALGNLIDNAIKFTLPGGRVRINARRQSDSMAEITLQDTGVGIGVADLPRVFERFHRGRPVMPDGKPLRMPGMGQGLYIARSVIEAHGGSIKVESEQGSGTRVICLLPLTSPVPMALQETQPMPLAELLPVEKRRPHRR